jgi:glycosyltransferase involved in cell wall biosynthesis
MTVGTTRFSAGKIAASVTAGEKIEQSRPSVLFVGTHPRPNIGTRSVTEGLAERLRDRGFHSILTSSANSRYVRVAEMLTTTWLKRHAYDVAHVDVYSGSAFRWAEWVTFVLRRLGKPFVLTLHGGNLPDFAQAHPRRVSRLLSHAAAVTTASRYLVEAVATIRSDVEVIPNPIETEVYTYSERIRPTPRIVWLRSFHRIYEPVLAIRVLARLAAGRDDAWLTMIGPDKDGSLALARAEARKLGVLSRVDFVGGVPKSDVPRLLAQSDIFLNTSTIDNTPVSVLEAMATGLLVVSTSVGGMAYLIDSGKDGILVEPGDAAAMEAAVKRYLAEPAFAARVSRNARAKAERFGWNPVLSRWEELLTNVARSKNSRNA